MFGSKRKPFSRQRRKRRILLCSVLSAVAVFLVAGYFTVVYSSIPTIAYWRTIWIETAMTTADHQWLATAFFPSEIIETVMQNTTSTVDIIGGQSHLVASSEQKDPADSDKSEDNQEAQMPEDPPISDILGQLTLAVGDTDYAGNTIKVNDIEQGLLISEVVGDGYRGLVMLIDDPARVYLAQTATPEIEGVRIRQMLADNDAIAGINASGFSDPGGQGTGGQVIGLSCSSGTLWGSYIPGYASLVFTEDHHLVVGNIPDWTRYAIRDGMQFGPVLIADGEVKLTGSAGYGLQPRTAIGQREDGVVIMLVIDGRAPTWSLGCTVGELARIMKAYGAVNAACCDGGSSSVLAYDGKVLNRNSSLNPDYGRRLPNAFLVAKK